MAYGAAGHRGRNSRPVGIPRGAYGAWAKLSRVVRIYLVNINFAEQGVGKIQRAPLTRTDIIVVVPEWRRMRVGMADDVEGFVGVDTRRNYGATLTTGHRYAERRLRRAWSADQRRRGQHRVGGRRGQIAVVGDQAGTSRRRDRNHVDKVGTDIDRRKSQVVMFELVNIRHQAAHGFPWRRENIETRRLVRS